MTHTESIYVNGIVHTMDSTVPSATAFAVRNGRFLACGTDSEVRGLASPGAKLIDLGGRTVIPGMTDAHTHLLWTSDAMKFCVGVHAPPHNDIPSMLARLREAAKAMPAGEWVFGVGNLMHEQRLAERRYPTRAELDTVSTEHPVVLRLAGHVHVLNSAALRRMGVPHDVRTPPGGYIGRDEKGDLDGLFLDAHAVLTLPNFPMAERIDAIPDAARDAFLRYGVTAVGDIVSADWHVRAFQHLKAQGRLPLRIGYYPIIPDALSVDTVRDFLTSSGLGDDSLFFAGLKLFADGGVSAKRAAWHALYPGTDTSGEIGWSEESFREIVRLALHARVQLALHAAGDRSFDFVLDIVEDELASGPGTAADARPWHDHRFRIEHVSHPYLTDERIARLKRSGAIGVGQAPHFYSMGDFWGRLLGDEAQALALRQRAMIDAGLTIPGSSDMTGSQPESSNPFLGMWTSVQHEATFGARYGQDQAITPYEALKSYTLDSAHAIRQEHVRGSITAGKLADFAVLDRDPLAIPATELREVTVLETYIDGEQVYGS